MKNLVFLAKVLHRLEHSGLLPMFGSGDIRCDVKDDSYHIDSAEHGHQSDQTDVVDHGHISDQAGVLSVEAGCLGFDTQEEEVEEEVEKEVEEEVDKTATRQRVRNLHWLIGRLSRIAKYEAGHHPKESLKVSQFASCW